MPSIGTILKLAPWAIAVLAVAFGLFELANYRGEVAARAQDKAKALELAAATAELDAINTRELQAKADAEKVVIQQEARDREDAINRAANSDVCRNSEPMRALFDGVRRRHSGADKPGGAGSR